MKHCQHPLATSQVGAVTLGFSLPCFCLLCLQPGWPGLNGHSLLSWAWILLHAACAAVSGGLQELVSIRPGS